MKKVQKQKTFQTFNLGTGYSIKIDSLYKLIKKKLNANPKIIRRRLENFDPKKSAGTYKKILKFLNIKKSSFTKLENGLSETINSIK